MDRSGTNGQCKRMGVMHMFVRMRCIHVRVAVRPWRMLCNGRPACCLFQARGGAASAHCSWPARQRSLLPGPTAQHAARALHLCCSSLYSSGLIRLFLL